MIKRTLETIRDRVEPNMLAISIGVVYLWFGSLKFFPALSPAEDLAKNTIHQLTFGLMSDFWAITLLAILEVGIGVLLLLNLWRRTTIVIALFHMALTFTPLILFPFESFQDPPWVPTLLGQYIGKNFIIVAALLSLSKKNLNLEEKRLKTKS